METFKELLDLNYKHYTENTVEELDALSHDSEHRIVENSMVLKWFRDKHNLSPTIVPMEKNKWKVILWDSVYLETIKENFSTFEEAQNSAINRLVEILKTKKQ